MSDNIPFELQMEIVQRIPDTKSVIRCRSVSKAWKSVIDSKDFVAAHTLRRHQANHLLIKTQVEYVSIVDDDTFPHQKVSVFVPDSANHHPMIIGSSHGLFCLFVYKTDTFVIWNPAIRKTVDILVPNVFSKRHLSPVIVGFGVCPRNLDPKLVKITCVSDWSKLQDENTSTQVEVFTLSSGGTWRSPLSSNVPHKSIAFGYSQAVVDGFIYWDAVDRIIVDDEFRVPNLIMSFDLTSEEFTKVNLPRHLIMSKSDLSVSKLRESLAVLEFEFHEYDLRTYHVWQMIGHGCTRSFNKLYSIKEPDVSVRTLLGFRKSGEPIIDVGIDDEDLVALAIYEQESKSITNIGIHGRDGSSFVHSYMETLLLHGH